MNLVKSKTFMRVSLHSYFKAGDDCTDVLSAGPLFLNGRALSLIQWCSCFYLLVKKVNEIPV